MPMVLERTARVTGKGQTTVPKSVRDALGVRPGDAILYRVEDGKVTLRRAEEEGAGDPALAPFLELIAADMAARPEAITPLGPGLLDRIEKLTGGMDVDLEEEIEGDAGL